MRLPSYIRDSDLFPCSNYPAPTCKQTQRTQRSSPFSDQYPREVVVPPIHHPPPARALCYLSPRPAARHGQKVRDAVSFPWERGTPAICLEKECHVGRARWGHIITDPDLPRCHAIDVGHEQTDTPRPTCAGIFSLDCTTKQRHKSMPALRRDTLD